MNNLGVSGSTIMSDASKFNHLFEYDLGHIEIGEFKNKSDYKLFLKLVGSSLLSFGIHAPIFRGKSKYDIIEHVHYPRDEAIKNLELDAKRAKYIGAKYLLVHFPFFSGHADKNTAELIENGLKKIHEIQKRYGIDIVCEPKLGDNRSPHGIEYLNDFPIEIWRKYGIKICIDVGDYVMAVGDKKAFDYIRKWSEFISVVHLHNVDYKDNDYFWKPMHQNDETDGHHDLAPIIKYLAGLDNIYFVLEHTPHMGYSDEYVMQGVEYIRRLICVD